MRRSVFAFTAPNGGYPGYLSVTDGAGGLEIVLRSPPGDAVCGLTAALNLPRLQARALAFALIAALAAAPEGPHVRSVP